MCGGHRQHILCAGGEKMFNKLLAALLFGLLGRIVEWLVARLADLLELMLRFDMTTEVIDGSIYN